MARKRDPRREEAFEIFKNSNGEIANRKIAELLDVPEKTISGWKSKDKWLQQLNGVLPKKKRSTPKNKGSTSKEKTPKLVIENDQLTEQQKLFCLFYLQHFNATKAYQQAYQCDYKTANAHGYRMLSHVVIKEELHRLKAELQQDIFLDVKDLIKEYVKQAFADITDFTEFGTETVDKVKETTTPNPEGSENPIVTTEKEPYRRSYVVLKNSDEIDGSLIQEVKKGKDGVSVKLYDKQKAMAELMKYLNGDELRIAQINNLKAKTNEIGGASTTDEVEDWKQAVIEAANKRAVKEDE